MLISACVVEDLGTVVLSKSGRLGELLYNEMLCNF
jgi:hypothetical protein